MFVWTKMEIKKYIPEITAVGIAELGAGALATKQAIEGNPVTAKELMTYFAFATFYVGIPVALVVNAVKLAYTLHKDIIFRKNQDNQ